MDIRLASTDARFGFVFTRRGLLPEATSSWFLPRIVGISRALEWIMSGRIVDSSAALESGLVTHVTEAEDLLPTAESLAQEAVEATSPTAVSVSKQLLWSMMSASDPWEAHRLESAGLAVLGRRADAREGITSFLEKRPAVFRDSVSDDYPTFVPPWPPLPASL